jgi:pSer/pThr/pTyr-binding forkhead associated (FHA) protein
MSFRIVQTAPTEGIIFTLKEGENTLGRDSANSVQLMSADVSRFHASLLATPEVCTLKDLKSANGTFVNGEKTSKKVLENGDKLVLSDFVFTFEEFDPASGQAVPFLPKLKSDRSFYATVKGKSPITPRRSRPSAATGDKKPRMGFRSFFGK